MLIFILINSLVVLSSLLLTKKLLKESGFADFIISWFTLYLGQVVLVELCLGVFNRLFLLDMFLTHFVILCAVVLYCRKCFRRQIIPEPQISFIFQNKFLLFSASIFLCFFLSKLIFNLINPPICADSLQYHLSFPAAWLRSGNLNNPIVIFGSKPTSAELTALTYYPINAELFFFWLMAPLRNAFLADVGEAPFYLIGIIAIFSILRKYEINKDTALFCGFLWALIPNIFKQLRTASQIDVMCAVLLLVFLNQLISLSRRPTTKNAIFLGITTGMLVGTKVLNVYWLITLAPLILYYLFRAQKQVSFKYFLAIIITALALTFIFGGFSYIRTFILTANPFYPVRIEILGKEIFGGFIDKNTFSNIFVNWKEFSLMKLFFREGLGVQFLGFILPATLIPVLLYPLFRRKGENYLEYALLFLTPFLMFMFYLFIIKAYWTRYFFSYLGIGLVAAILFLDRFRWKNWYIWGLGTLSIIIASISLANRTELVVSLAGSILLFILLLIYREKLFMNIQRSLNLKNIFYCISTILIALSLLNIKYDQEELSRYSLPFSKRELGQRDISLAWKWLDDYAGKGLRIAYTGRSEIYPLFGSKIKNDVIYVSVNDKPNLPHYYVDGLYRKVKDFSAWMNNLKKERIDLLFIGLPHAINNESADPSQFPIEDQWAKEHPQNFKLVFNNSLARIYKVSLNN